MVTSLLIPILLTCTTPQLTGALLNTTHGDAAAQQLETLPRDDSVAWSTLGTLFANRIFMMESRAKRQDADSALYYFKRAQAVCPENVVIASYIAVAIGLRAKEDGWFRKLTGKTERHAHDAFVQMDTLRQQNLDNLAVQFLAACMFRDAPPQFDDARQFQLSSYETFQRLHCMTLELESSDFFTPEVHGHILLSLALLVRKLESRENATLLSCQYIAQLLENFPYSPAAVYAKTKNLQCE